MKFLLDMGLARSTAEHLRQGGHDAVHLREQGLQRLPDQDIVDKAVREGRIILTHDLDFGRIVALSQAQQPSVVTFRLEDMRAVRVNQYLQEIITRFAGELRQGALISVSEQGIRVRRLPAGQ
jgi:predicted nuclease of predicted toxin-antitoxin system